MKYSEATQGRTFIIRLEDGDIVHEEIEKFAKDHSINAAYLQILGGVDVDSKLIVGPERGRDPKIVPMECQLKNVYEVSGTGTIFPDEDGVLSLHMHIACGRNETTITGCIRNGVKTWHILEVIIVELLNSTARRVYNEATGFKLLQP
jgi:predicted DNA-binding protein with PD1-like motif